MILNMIFPFNSSITKGIKLKAIKFYQLIHIFGEVKGNKPVDEVSSICVNKVFSHLFVKKVFLQMEIKLRPRIRTLLNCSSFLDLLYER